MEAHTGLQLRTEQRLALMPQMLQSIEILQLAAVDLVTKVAEELERNEALELSETLGQSEVPSQPKERRDEDVWRPAPSSGGDEDRKQAFLSNVPADCDSLLDYIRQQLAWQDLPPALHDAVWLLAQHLDDKGLLPADDAEVARLLNEQLGGEALDTLQGLEPRGIGARSTVEALLLQVPQNDPDRPLLAEMLHDHLQALARNKIPDVARALGLEPEEVEQLVGRLQRLETRPASRFREHAAAGIRPDARVEIGLDGELRVRTTRGSVPSLAVNEDYVAMAEDRNAEKAVRTYVKDKVRSARDLIAAVHHRQETLVRVVAAVMSHQSHFLDQGRGAVTSLKMQDIADELELHTSTVSRAISGKFVETPHGVLPLRDFFDGGEDGQTVGRLGVKERLRQLVEAEDRTRPLSDDDLVALLERHGAKVARRTVSKYRKELGIPSSWHRRRYGER